MWVFVVTCMSCECGIGYVEMRASLWRRGIGCRYVDQSRFNSFCLTAFLKILFYFDIRNPQITKWTGMFLSHLL